MTQTSAVSLLTEITSPILPWKDIEEDRRQQYLSSKEPGWRMTSASWLPAQPFSPSHSCCCNNPWGWGKVQSGEDEKRKKASSEIPHHVFQEINTLKISCGKDVCCWRIQWGCPPVGSWYLCFLAGWPAWALVCESCVNIPSSSSLVTGRAPPAESQEEEEEEEWQSTRAREVKEEEGRTETYSLKVKSWGKSKNERGRSLRFQVERVHSH